MTGQGLPQEGADVSRYAQAHPEDYEARLEATVDAADTRRKQRKEQPADVVVTRPFMDAGWGLYALVYMQVCAYGEVPEALVEARANALNPSGTKGRWRIVREGPGEPPVDLSPGPCADDPARLHYMLAC